MELVSVEKIWAEIKRNYDSRFIDELIKLPGAHVYAFGGIVTDLTLGKQWKDLDIRVIWDVETEKFKELPKLLENYVTVVQTFEFPAGTVIRVKETTGKDMIIDVGVARNFEKFRADFSASAIFIDLKTGEVVELHPSCVDDLQNGIIRTIDDPEEQLSNDPSQILRALKFAAKTGFVIETTLDSALKNNTGLVKNAVADVIAHLQKNGKDSISEYFLGNIFGGLKHDAVTYVRLLEAYGFLFEITQAVSKFVTSDKVDLGNDIKYSSFQGLESFEEKLSVLLSIFARALNSNPRVVFDEIKHVFALDTGRSDGNEFNVNPAKIIYVTNG